MQGGQILTIQEIKSAQTQRAVIHSIVVSERTRLAKNMDVTYVRRSAKNFVEWWPLIKTRV